MKKGAGMIPGSFLSGDALPKDGPQSSLKKSGFYLWSWERCEKGLLERIRTIR